MAALGALHHLIAGGIERGKVFDDAQDRWGKALDKNQAEKESWTDVNK
jgi:hypothetical protein